MLIEMKAANRAELARTEDPGADFSGTKTKIATSCGNVFETNILLASAESVRRNGNQHNKFIVKRFSPLIVRRTF